MKAHTLAKGKRVIQRLGHAVSEGLFLIPPGHRFNGQQLLQRLQLLSPRAGIAQRYGCIFRSGTHAGRDRLLFQPRHQESGNKAVPRAHGIHHGARNDLARIEAFAVIARLPFPPRVATTIWGPSAAISRIRALRLSSSEASSEKNATFTWGSAILPASSSGARPRQRPRGSPWRERRPVDFPYAPTVR